MKAARARVLVTGRVQGVFFRARTREAAAAAGLSGWVRNRPDGSVEAVFEGRRDAVESLVEWSRRGPSAARVDSLEVTWEEPLGEAGFTVIY